MECLLHFCAADERRRYLLDLLQSNALPEALGACDDGLDGLLARTEDEKVLFEKVERTLRGKEATPVHRGSEEGRYSRLATGREVAPLVTLALEVRRPEGDLRLQSLISFHVLHPCS